MKDAEKSDTENSDLNQIFAYGGTWYDKGIYAAEKYFETNMDGSEGLEPKSLDDLATQQTIAYFLTDGAPTSGHAEDEDIEHWNQFVEAKVDLSIAVGFKNHEEIQDSGILDRMTSHGDALIVKDVNQLDTVISNSVNDVAGSFSSFTDETSKISFGADGGHLATLKFTNSTEGEQVLSYDSFNVRQIAQLDYGELEVNFETGFYIYKPKELVDVVEIIDIKLVDKDGDIDSAEVTMNISYVNNFVYDSEKDSDATDNGIGTLIFNTEDKDIDFSQIDNNKLSNFESINLNTDSDGHNRDHQLTKLSLEDVIGLTDTNNKLSIFGDDNDKVEFFNNNGEWTKEKTIEINNGHSFGIYTHSGDSSVEVKIEATINDSII